MSLFSILVSFTLIFIISSVLLSLGLFYFFFLKLKQDRIFNISVSNHPQNPGGKIILTSIRINFAFGLRADLTREHLLFLTSFIQHSVCEVCSCHCLLNSDLCVIYWGCSIPLWASLVAQLVKNPPAMQETPVGFLGQDDPLEKGSLPTPVFMGFPGGSDGKESACNVGDLGLIPGLGRSSEGGHGNPLQDSCLVNSRGQKSLAGYSPWVCKGSDTTE